LTKYALLFLYMFALTWSLLLVKSITGIDNFVSINENAMWKTYECTSTCFFNMKVGVLQTSIIVTILSHTIIKNVCFGKEKHFIK